MRIIIPMAGRGTRLRPHTLTLPKPLIPIAGKPMVQRIVEDLSSGYEGSIEEIAFVIGDFGEAVERQLADIAARFGAKARIYYQDEPLGVAHAIGCAGPSLEGPIFIAFSDTLFNADFHFDPTADGVIWVKKVEDPASFGVVKVDENNIITEFVEKSPVFVSDLAIVGLYYIRDGAYLRSEIERLIREDIRDKGEYQITSVLENMKKQGTRFVAAPIDEWLDCGNKQNIIQTNRRMLEIKMQQETLRHPDAEITDSVVIEPCYIGPGARIRHSVVGPYTSVGAGTVLENSIVRNSVIQDNSTVRNALLTDSLIGNHVQYAGRFSDVSIGDYSTLSE